MSLSCTLSNHLVQKAARRVVSNVSCSWRLHFRNSSLGKLPVLNSYTCSRGKHTRVVAIGSGTLSKQAAPASRVDTDSPWLVVGLGNPGARYNGTRHNVSCSAQHMLANHAKSFK